MIIEYSEKYKQEVINLLIELQQHLADIDVEGYNILTENYGEQYFEKVLNEVILFQGKMFLYNHNDKILGLVAGVINNDAETTLGFCAPKRGRVTELIVSKNARGRGIGEKLLSHVENHLYSVGCKDVLLSLFAYNESAKGFYEKMGYHARLITMIKSK